MTKIFGTRGSGKTTKLLEFANNKGYVLVVPLRQTVDRVQEIVKHKGYNVEVISANEFVCNRIYRADEHYLVDDLEMFLQVLGIEGYSSGF